MKVFWRPRVRPARPVAPRLRVHPLEDRSVPAAAPPAFDPSVVVVAARAADPSAPPVVRTEAVPPGLSVEQTVAGWLTTPGVAYAEPDYLVRTAAVPNDAYFGSQYAQNNTGQTGGTADADIDAAEAWDLTTGSTATTVAVIDTGVDYTHRDLYQNIWINQAEIPPAVRANLTDTDGDGLITFWDLNAAGGVNVGPGRITDLNGNGTIDGGDLLRPAALGGWADGVDAGPTGPNGAAYLDDLVGWNFAASTNDPLDTTDDGGGHGTHVAGTVAAVGNNGTDVAGVAWKARVMALKFISGGSGSDANAARAVRYAADNGAFATNNSWGGTGYSQALRDAIGYAGARGSVFVAAAGNSGADVVASDFFPAKFALPSYNLPNVVSVAATDANDRLASFSNTSPTAVSLAAPGVSIISTYPGNSYAFLSGTSMATPQVTGTFALVKSLDPSISSAGAVARVLGAVDRIPAAAGRTITGGRLNAARALTAPGPVVTGLTPGGVVAGPVAAVRLTFAGPVDPATFTPADVALTAPGGAVAVAVASVVGSGNTQYDLTFAPQPAPGLYTVRVGPDIRDPAGNPMNQNGSGVGGEVPGDQYVGTFSVAPAAAAVFVGADAATAGSWPGRYGAGGYALAGGPAALPGGAAVAPGGQLDYAWAASTPDPRALQRPGAADRLAACWYAADGFTLDVAPAGGGAGRVSLYLVDWDRLGRAERVEVVDPATGAVLDARDAAAFGGGTYLTWAVSGPVRLRLTNAGGRNAVVSAVFLDPVPAGPSAAFAGADGTTGGSWVGRYGAGGYALAGGPAAVPAPAGVAVAVPHPDGPWAWEGSTADPRGLQKPGAADRLAACWYTPWGQPASAVTADITPAGSAPYRVTAYLVDWDRRGRAARVEVVDPATGAVLDARDVPAYGEGVYLTWQVTGPVRLRLTRTAAENVALSAVFLD